MSYTVGDLVAEFLSRMGVTTAFGIVSVHNISMLDGIGRRNAIRYVMCRGEMGGAHMADAYARVTGGLGVLFTSTGPGMANSIGGLVEARFAGSPVLHITGQTARNSLDRDMGTVHDVPGQAAILAASGKAGDWQSAATHGHPAIAMHPRRNWAHDRFAPRRVGPGAGPINAAGVAS